MTMKILFTVLLVAVITCADASRVATKSSPTSGLIPVAANRQYNVAVPQMEKKRWDTSSAIGPNVVNDRVFLIYGGIGRVPHLGKNKKTGEWNWKTGVPQSCNLTEHARELRSGTEAVFVSQYNFTGNISDWTGIVIVDYEAFLLSWELANIADIPYQQASINYTKWKYPLLANDTAVIESLAKAEYESAAMEIFLESVSILKEMMPKAEAVGFYAYPRYIQGWWQHTPEAMRLANDRLMPLWQAVTGFFPSLYYGGSNGTLPFDSNFNKTMEGMDGALTECARLQKLLTAGSEKKVKLPKVMPFTWYRNHGGHNAYLSNTNAWLEFVYPFNMAGDYHIDGQILWGYEPKEDTYAETQQYLVNKTDLFTAPSPQP